MFQTIFFFSQDDLSNDVNESDPLLGEGTGASAKDPDTNTDISDDSTQHEEPHAATEDITDPTKPGRKTGKLKVSEA